MPKKPRNITSESRPNIWIPLKKLDTWREIKAEAEKQKKGVGGFICDMWVELKRRIKNT